MRAALSDVFGFQEFAWRGLQQLGSSKKTALLMQRSSSRPKKHSTLSFRLPNHRHLAWVPLPDIRSKDKRLSR
jgi:hypothetical protein